MEEDTQVQQTPQKKDNTIMWIVIIALIIFFVGIGYVLYTRMTSKSDSTMTAIEVSPTSAVMVEDEEKTNDEMMTDEENGDTMIDEENELTPTSAPTSTPTQAPVPTNTGSGDLQSNPTSTPEPTSFPLTF